MQRMKIQLPNNFSKVKIVAQEQLITLGNNNVSQLVMWPSERFISSINIMKGCMKIQLLSNFSKSKNVAQETVDNPGQKYEFSLRFPQNIMYKSNIYFATTILSCHGHLKKNSKCTEMSLFKPGKFFCLIKVLPRSQTKI